MASGLRKVIERVVEKTGRYRCMLCDTTTASHIIATSVLKTDDIHLREMDRIGSNAVLRKNDKLEVYGRTDFKSDKVARISVRAMRQDPATARRIVVFDTTTTWCVNNPSDTMDNSSSS